MTKTPAGLPERWPPTETNGRLKVDPKVAIGLALTLLGWIVTVALAWGGQGARISIVEAKQQENERRLERIEQKLDQLLQRP